MIKYGHDLLDAGGEFRRLACTSPQAVTSTDHVAEILDV
jgi:hypothetical protein